MTGASKRLFSSFTGRVELMKNARIFLIGNGSDDLSPMEESPYSTEDVLQVLLARYPDLLPGDQITPDDPRRWLLVSRELSVPDDKAVSGRWSLDHLFLDQHGIPTFVECKRSSDTRSRREVVAQMLDYAANGIVYWTMDQIRQAATETVNRSNKSLDEEILQLLQAEEVSEVESFWREVESNLRAGKVRLIFVADSTSKELRRLIEFLNEKMSDVEVLAVEIKQFVGNNNQKVLVPRVVGLTEAARTIKTEKGTKRRITQSEFLATCSPEAAQVFESVLEIAAKKGHTIYWGVAGFSIRAYLPKADQYASFILGFPPDSFQFYFGHLPLPEEEMKALRTELMGLGIFRESGKKTLKVALQGKVLTQINQVYDLILKKMDEIIQTY